MKKSSSQKQGTLIRGRHLSAAGLISVGLIVFLAVGISSGNAQAPPPLRTYHLTDLGVLPAKKARISIPAAINDQGQVTGTSGMSAVDESAFLYDPKNNKGMLEDLSREFGGISHGFGINGVGDVVGDSTFGNSESASHAALFVRNGKIIDLGILKNTISSTATGINASGLVVGYCFGKPGDTSVSRAFLWNASMGMIDIGTLGGARAQAFGINDAGLVTGTSQIAETSRAEINHAFIYNYRSMSVRNMIDLGTLGGSESVGTAINANNHVVGYSTLSPNDDRRVHAFLYDGMKMRDLGALGGFWQDQSYALGVNILDQVVGYTYVPAISAKGDTASDYPTIQAAFIYTQGEMMNLNELIGPAAKSYWLQSATGINNYGQIVAVAEDLSTYELHAVLLTP